MRVCCLGLALGFGLGSAPTLAYGLDVGQPTAGASASTSSDQIIAEPPANRLRTAGSLSASALIPHEGYARETAGMSISGGMWLQREHLVLEPRASIRFDVAGESREYVHLVPLELGAYWLESFEDTALFVGPGFSLEFLSQEVNLKSTIGSEITATSERTLLEFDVCTGVYARAGVIFARSGPLSTALSVDYALTFVALEETQLQRAIRLNLGLIFGRGGR